MDSEFFGWTALHDAAKHGNLDRVRQLLAEGADPNAREAGDNTYPLHWAAARGDLEIIRALLDAGGDVHGIGDVHELDVIGWATVFTGPTKNPREVADLLVVRGARHHIFSAVALGDLDLIRAVVAADPKALDRRQSRFERKLTPLHFAIGRRRQDILDLLIALGADVEAADMNGQTALAFAIVGGDRDAVARLQAAGAKAPQTIAPSRFKEEMAKLAGTIQRGTPMIFAPDVAAALEWYTSIGFTEIGRVDDDGLVNWGMVSFGKAQLMLNMHGKKGEHDVNLWFDTDRVDEMYQLLKARQLASAQAKLDGAPDEHAPIEFAQDIYVPPYGALEFTILDLNGYRLSFLKQR
ncbi:MAG TPA: ankyrin repeat domain-containing protein [Vicinamibacterales bacterium]|nr:ankyrin repeat domain-containing protein [Vicinamibacterales bacterium]